MLDKKIFLEQIRRLEVAYNHPLPEGGHKIWKDELDKSRISDETLKLGVDKIILRENGWFPSVGSLIKVSRDTSREEKEQLAKEKRREQEKRDDKDWLENASKKGGQIARDCTDLMRKLINEQIEPGEQYYREMIKLEKKYPGIGFKGRARIYADEQKRFTANKGRPLIWER